VLLLTFFVAPAQAADQIAALNSAREQMQKNNFTGAAETLRMAIYKDGQSPATWYLLAQCYEKQNQVSTAVRTYSMIMKHFPASAEAASARLLIPGLEKQHLVRPSGTKVEAVKAVQPVEKELKLRVTIIPPRFDHKPVAQQTITIIRNVVSLN